jgi:two-component system, cell cycle response regulator CpdR
MARILLADDEAASRDLVCRALEADGHTVRVMSGGAEAFDAIEAAPGGFDVLVSDVNMPGMDGLELAKKALAINPALAVILMSGFVEQLERGKTLATGTVRTISKPFTLEQIRTLVRSVMAA